jgi:hypothetical protein
MNRIGYQIAGKNKKYHHQFMPHFRPEKQAIGKPHEVCMNQQNTKSGDNPEAIQIERGSLVHE